MPASRRSGRTKAKPSSISQARVRATLKKVFGKQTELIALRADATVSPVLDDRRRWVHHGSSVSHGSVAVHPTEPWPVVAAVVPIWIGIVLGKNSGLPSVQEFCEKLNIPATEEQMMAMIPLIKEKSFAKKDLLTEAEFMKIVDKVLKRKAS